MHIYNIIYTQPEDPILASLSTFLIKVIRLNMLIIDVHVLIRINKANSFCYSNLLQD